MRKQLTIATLLLCSNALADSPPTVSNAVDIGIKTQQESTVSQQHINHLDDATAKLLREYRTVLRETDSIQTYNQQLQRLIDSQKEHMHSLDQQLAELNVTEREITPFMLRMVDTLEQFIALDKPFLIDERRSRVTQLRLLLNDSQASLAEKYRRIMEAYLIETDYGHSIEGYQGKLDDNHTVDFLRIGRLALYYISLDRQQAGFWDQQRKQWQTLGSEYINTIDQGIRMAHKQMAPQLLTLPVSRGGAQ